MKHRAELKQWSNKSDQNIVSKNAVKKMNLKNGRWETKSTNRDTLILQNQEEENECNKTLPCTQHQIWPPPLRRAGTCLCGHGCIHMAVVEGAHSTFLNTTKQK